jgi:hypothetical protein
MVDDATKPVSALTTAKRRRISSAVAMGDPKKDAMISVFSRKSNHTNTVEPTSVTTALRQTLHSCQELLLQLHENKSGRDDDGPRGRQQLVQGVVALVETARHRLKSVAGLALDHIATWVMAADDPRAHDNQCPDNAAWVALRELLNEAVQSVRTLLLAHLKEGVGVVAAISVQSQPPPPVVVTSDKKYPMSTSMMIVGRARHSSYGFLQAYKDVFGGLPSRMGAEETLDIMSMAGRVLCRLNRQQPKGPISDNSNRGGTEECRARMRQAVSIVHRAQCRLQSTGLWNTSWGISSSSL